MYTNLAGKIQSEPITYELRAHLAKHITKTKKDLVWMNLGEFGWTKMGLNEPDRQGRLGKCCHPHHPGWCKIFKVWVKFITESTMFCRKFISCHNFCIFWVYYLWDI